MWYCRLHCISKKTLSISGRTRTNIPSDAVLRNKLVKLAWEKAQSEKNGLIQIQSLTISQYLKEKNLNCASFSSCDPIESQGDRKAHPSIQFPFQNINKVHLSNEDASPQIAKKENPNITLDRGFHVVSDHLQDEYIAGTCDDLPEVFRNVPGSDPRTKIPPKDRPYLRYRQRFGPTDAVEEIEFQQPHQQVTDKQWIRNEDNISYDWQIRYGRADPSIPPSDKNCPACGARFHCQNPSLAGFVPDDLFIEMEKSPSGYDDTLCRRCYLLKNHNFLLNVNVSPVDYEAVMGKLKNMHEILLILIVDMLDMPGSIYKQLPYIIGGKKPMIIVGNKVDLLPPDQKQGYLANFQRCLKQATSRLGFNENFNVIKHMLISAKTGYNIENLITLIQTKWGVNGDVYLIGSTNTGKSTLFNAFLQSDMCKVRAVDLVERATTSIWPGTTMSLLKFPVMNPTPYRLQQRSKRLKRELINYIEERRHQNMLLKGSDQDLLLLQSYVGRTFSDVDEFDKHKFVVQDRFFLTEQTPKKSPTWNPEDIEFAQGCWCHDTPGTVNEDQIINLLTLDELVKVLPNSVIRPRTHVLNQGQSLMIGGLGRLHLEEGRNNLFCTVFASHKLPINVLYKNELIGFYNRYAGTEKLGAPLGGRRRLKFLPKLKPQEIVVFGDGYNKSCVDIVLSSIGWVALTGHLNSEYVLNAYTPNALGITLRKQPMLPYAVNLKGPRIRGSTEYRVKPIEMPIIQ